MQCGVLLLHICNRTFIIQRLPINSIPIPLPVLEHTVGVNVINRALRAAVELGASRPVLLAALGVGESRLRHPFARLSASVLIRLLELIDRELRDPAKILQMSFLAGPMCFSDIGYIGLHGPDLGSALETQIRNQVLRQNLFRVTLERDSAKPCMRWDMEPGYSVNIAAMLEFMLGVDVKLCADISAGASSPLQCIKFMHKARFYPVVYEEIYGCPVQFGADYNAIEFCAGALQQATPRPHPALVERGWSNFNKIAKWMTEGSQMSAQAYFYLSSELNKSPTTLDRMASAFGLSERTLRRRLDEEGSPFRALLDEVRQDMCALYQMEASRSLSEVAMLLGYAELSAFSRAYRRWYGTPASAWTG